MKKTLLLLAPIFLLSACVSKLSTQAERIRIITTNQKESCEYITIVSAHSAWGANSGHNQEGVLNELRNKAVEKGGNALFLINVGATGLFSEEASGNAEVFNCKF